MGTNNYMLADFRAIFLSCCLFSLIAFGPGYALGHLFNILQFRKRTLACRIALSVALSISLGPILTYFVGRYASLTAAFAVFGGLSIYAGFRLLAEFAQKRATMFTGLRQYSKSLGLVCAWVVIALLSLSDLQIGRRLYFSIIGFDYCVRASFTSAVSTFGIPPPNPFYFPGHSVLLRYHYFWLAQAALIHHIASRWIDARQAFIGATIWCGAGVLSIVALYLRFFSPKGTSELPRRMAIGFCLLAVTGLDILPTMFVVLLKRLGIVATIFPSVEWWNNQIDGFLYTMLWEPHYLAALIASLTGFLLLWRTSPAAGRKDCVIAAVAAGLAFATGVGAGLYIALVFAVFLLGWMIVTLWKGWHRETLLLTSAGIVALGLSTPFVLSLRTTATGGALLHATVRSFFFGEYLLQALGLSQPWQLALGNALFLPLNYFLELGFYLLAAKIWWDRFRRERRRLTRYELATVIMILASAGVCTFLRSGVISNNDLGWRGFVIAQFALLILATDLWAVRSTVKDGVPLATLPQRRWLTLMLILGAAGAVYDLTILRLYPVLSDANVVAKLNWVATDNKLGPRTYANRQAYEWLRANSSPSAIIQQNPIVALQDTFYGLYANRRTVAEASDCGTVFGGDTRACQPMVKVLAALFAQAGSSDVGEFTRACESLGVQDFVAKDIDPAWKNPQSWVWQLKPIYANSFVRIFRCAQPTGNTVLTYRRKNRD